MKVLAKLFSISLIMFASYSHASCTDENVPAKRWLEESHFAIVAVPSKDSVIVPSSATANANAKVKTEFSVLRDFKRNKLKKVTLISDEGTDGERDTFKRDEGYYLISGYIQNGKYHINDCTYNDLEYVSKEFIKELNAL